ncbi:MAG: phosphohydrolase [Archaeoglobales archaeon]|nr:MAG: phosphohydrolase [Archaeoglobales archaeon]
MDEIVKLMFELGILKLIPRSGWFKIGIRNPESVAEHSFRTAFIASILTFLETKDFDKACKACLLGLIHDLKESRTLDLHKLSMRYVDVRRDAFEDQLKLMPDDFVNDLKKAMEDLMDYVKDADQLELLLQAKEYSEINPSSILFTRKVNFKTETAKKLAEIIERSNSRWWLELE